MDVRARTGRDWRVRRGWHGSERTYDTENDKTEAELDAAVALDAAEREVTR